jgi:S-adenosyl methyltransferase
LLAEKSESVIGDRPSLACLADARDDLFPAERLGRAAALAHQQRRMLARQGIWRFAGVGDGCYPLVHQALPGFGSTLYRVAYAGTAAHNVPGDLMVSITGDISDPGLVTGSQVIRELFGDEDRPVAVLVPGVLERFADAGEARQFVSALMDWAPEGSFLAASHALTDGTNADVNTTAATAGSAIMRRTLADITALFDGLTLLRPGVVEVSRWRVSGAARTQYDPPVLRRAARVARKGVVRSGPSAVAWPPSPVGPPSRPTTQADGHSVRSRT